jgi:hypothetical protein
MLADLILQPTIARAHFPSELFVFLLMYDAFGPQELLQNIWLVILSPPLAEPSTDTSIFVPELLNLI